MKARSVSRELALLTLFQMKEEGGQLLWDKNSLKDTVLESVRTLQAMAQEQIAGSAQEIAAILEQLEDYELRHPQNAKLTMEEAVPPVPLPTTADLTTKLKTMLGGLENLNDALDLPEILAFSSRDEVMNYTTRLINLVIDHQKAIDEKIDSISTDWRVSRMLKMDRALIRLGVAQLCYAEDLDAPTVIDEMLSLAERFTTEESLKFIHGLMGRVADDLAAENPAPGFLENV